MPILIIAYAAIVLLLTSGFYLYRKSDNKLYLIMIFVGILMLVLLALTTFLFYGF